MLLNILLILAATWVIYWAGNFFAGASSAIGSYLGLSKSVKGATFDAIASSLPELMVSLYSVIWFGKFEVGIGTIAGSALFNVLIIPGICVLVAPVAFKVSKQVITRDGFYYVIAVLILLLFIFYLPDWTVLCALFLLLAYGVYIRLIVRDTANKFRNNWESEKNANREGIDIKKELVLFASGIACMGAAAYILTGQSIALAEAIHLPFVVIAFTITAAATSVPDTVISVVNAKKGDIDDAVSNVFGSNIFDILVGLGLPLLIYTVFFGSYRSHFDHSEIVMGVLVATIIVLFFFADGDEMNSQRLSKKQGIVMLAMYAVFVAYAIFVS